LASALNHPHILTVYDAGEFEGRQYLVTEFVDGGTLKTWAKQEPRTWRQVIELLTGVADGLAAAHQAGILHRDIKPENILVAKNGYAKLADFGLAKAAEGADVDLTRTLTERRTRAGVIVGTIAYMSPEQASGKPLDARSDIFSFGIVLYEILGGKRPFTGASDLELLKTIIHGSPEPLGGEMPLALRNVVEKALEKDAADRYQTMREMVVDLRRSLRPGKEEPESAPQPQRKRRWLPWAVAAVMTVAAAGVAGYFLTRPAPPPLISQFTVDAPPDTTFTNVYAATAVSPDGRYLVFGASGSVTASLWLRPLDSRAARPLPGTEGANFPFWSPDSKSIAFFAGGKVKRIEPAGGAPLVLCDAGEAVRASVGGTWSRDGIILFGGTDGLRRVPASGGQPVLLTKTDVSRQEAGHGYPQFLPDGKRFLYFIQSGNPNTQGIYAGSLDRPQERIPVIKTDAKAIYTQPIAGRSSYLLWLREQTLFAQRFDPGKLLLEGDPAPVAEEIAVNLLQRAAFWTSDAGLLVYRNGGIGARSLVWMSRDGKRQQAGPDLFYGSLRLSPDGKRVAFGRSEGAGQTEDIWLLEFARSVTTRLTFDPKRDIDPVWSPDGRQIAFSSNRSGFFQIYRKDAGGGGQEEQLTQGPNDKFVTDWSRDGRYLLYAEVNPNTQIDLWALPLDGDRKPVPVLQSAFTELAGQFSPDGKWIAYQSNESGRTEVYIRAFPTSAGKWQISNRGGMIARWRADGKELFYRTPDNSKVMAVTIRDFDCRSFSVRRRRRRPALPAVGGARSSGRHRSADGCHQLAGGTEVVHAITSGFDPFRQQQDQTGRTQLGG
jgi:Tol biopolymer transport system component